MDLKHLTICTAEIARQASEFIKQQAENFDAGKVEQKGKHDLVSYVDKTSEKIIIDGLSVLLPEAGFIAEEGTLDRKGEKYNWIIDPLDGTTNFVHGLPPYAISIALMEGKELVLGVVHEVNLHESFYAWKNGGAWLNGKQIFVSKTGSVENSLLATGFPYSNYSRLEPFMKTIWYFMQNSRGLRRLGSAATDMAYVACGRFDGFYEYSLQPWDVAAGIVIIREAGGMVSDFDGGSNFLFGKEIVTSNPAIFNEFFKTIHTIMNQ